MRSIEHFSCKKLFQDMQERLLVMSHYRLQQTLDTAPSMSQNSIAKLLLATEETTSGAKVFAADSAAASQETEMEFQILEETIPYSYVNECLSLLKQLESRLQSDIYRTSDILDAPSCLTKEVYIRALLFKINGTIGTPVKSVINILRCSMALCMVF